MLGRARLNEQHHLLAVDALCRPSDLDRGQLERRGSTEKSALIDIFGAHAHPLDENAV
jgi:hypothetical protein